MRRSDREVTDKNELVEIINRCDILRVAMVEKGVPYIVPLNFGFERNDNFTFYMHSARTGRKIDILKENPYVCFELDCSFRILKDESPCQWSAEHESVIGYGEVSILDDIREKKHAMDCIMNKYGHVGDTHYNETMFSKTCLYKILVTEITGKRNIKD